VATKEDNMSETADELRALSERLCNSTLYDPQTRTNLMLGAADAIDGMLARLAAAEAEIQSGWRMHANACERHIDLGIRIMDALAEGRPLIDVLDLVGDDLNEVDAVDDESIALYEKAKAALALRDPS
jgi:hypothetical protein